MRLVRQHRTSKKPGSRRAMTAAGAVLALLLALAPSPAGAADKLYPVDTLIVPMDTTYQDYGMLQAYGLVDSLLRNGVPVDWVIAPDKAYGDADFTATAEDVQTTAAITDHGYRGGPFVVDAEHYATALPVVQAWQAAHPDVAVHRATEAFTANAARELFNAPTIAVFADGKEDIAFGYLNAAGIPMSNGDPWPADKDKNGLYDCPGDKCCPDCFNEQATAGPTTTSHTDGALFDAAGIPRYCQFMSMHYGHPADVPEVVAEVREFLSYPVHFFAECQAVNAFENAPDGHFLTTLGLEAAGKPGAVDHFHSDDPFAQADGAYENPGGSEPSFSLAPGSAYWDVNVVMLAEQGSPTGQDDIWLNGYVDGDPTQGKVSYLGAHSYAVDLPISGNPKTQGTRYFLNSLFEAPCSSDDGLPNPSTWVDGASGTNEGIYTVTVCYDNPGPGIAFDTVMTLHVPAGAGFVSATGGGAPSGDTVVWNLGSLPAGSSGCETATVSLPAEGTYEFTSELTYEVGINTRSVTSSQSSSVTYGSVNLLRYGMSSPGPLSAVFAAQHPADPALDPAANNEVTAFVSGASFPNDVADLGPGSPFLVFYELEGTAADTLRVDKGTGKIVITY